MLRVAFAPSREPNRLAVAATNTGPEPLALLYWGTPFDPAAPGGLRLTAEDGSQPRRVGPHAKYGFDPEASLIRFAPGETRTATLDLAGLYALVLSGRYLVDLDPAAWRAVAAERVAAIESAADVEIAAVTAETALVVLTAAPPDEARPPSAETLPDTAALLAAPLACPPTGMICVPPGYRDAGYECRGIQYISYPRLAMGAARAALVKRLSTELSARLYRYSIGSSATFAKWFGPFTNGSRATAQQVIGGIAGQAACKWYTITDLGPAPKPDLFAVFRRVAEPNKTPLDLMGLYPRFFAAPDFGIDSKIGTLAHELSHGYGLTRDIAYGTRDCAALAKRDPAGALANADNYEYFLEETLLRA